MNTYRINSSNVSTAINALEKKDTYFIIETDVILPAVTININSSILAFRGGSFIGSTSSILNLISSQVSAGSYPIFKGGMKVQGLSCPEVRAEWFKDSTDTSDDVYINRAISMANGIPVVLENRAYTLAESLEFNNTVVRQTLICPGTLKPVGNDKNNNIPAININAQTVTLKINRIEGVATSSGYKGIGIKFSDYIAHSNIEVNIMCNLNRGFSVDPDMNGCLNSDETQKYAGIQYCRIEFGTIKADYCFYVDIFKGAVVIDSETNKPLTEIPTNTNKFEALQVKLSNWFSESHISGESMQGKYGIYIKDLKESTVDPRLYGKLNNVMNGLKFENISFENITGLALRVRSVMRSTFLNLQMFNNMPGSDPVGTTDFTPWIDLDSIREIRMTFNSYVVPNHIKIGNDCKNTYINGAILDDPANYGSHFDTLGIDTLYGKDTSNQLVQKSQMFVTSSVTPFNMTKNLVTESSLWATEKFLSDLLPEVNEGITNSSQISIPVLPAMVNVEIDTYRTLIINLSGLKNFPPCVLMVKASINQGTLQFRTSDNTVIEDAVFEEKATYKKSFTESGLYSIQWLSNWVIRITKV